MGLDARIETLDRRTIVGVAALSNDSTALTAIGDGLGLTLPVTPAKTAVEANRTALWLGPGRWLVTAPLDGEVELLDWMAGFTKDHAISIICLSDGYTVFALSGPDASDVLAHGCSLDLHDSVFGVGHCTRTGLAAAEMILHKISAAPVFEVYVDTSFASYVGQWFEKIIDGT